MTESNMDAPARIKCPDSLSNRLIQAGLLGGIFFLPLCLDVAIWLLALAGIFLAGKMVWTGAIVIRRTRLDPWLAGFAVLAAASTPGSIFAYESWYNYYHVVTLYLLVYGLTTQSVTGAAGVKNVAAAMLASAAVVCLYGFFQYSLGLDVTAERWVDGQQFPELKTRIFSTLGNPNVLAAFLIMVGGLAGGWSTDPQCGWRRYSLTGLSLAAFSCLVLTYSRGAWLAAGFMAVFTAVAWRRPGRGILAGLALILALLVCFSQEALINRFLSIFDTFNSDDSSVALRWALLESTLAMVAEQPWLGIGWGVYPYVYPYYDFFIRDETVMIYHAHNSLLSLAAEIGIPGMLCFLSACTIAMARMVRQIKRNRDGKGLQFGIVLSMAGLAVFSLTDHVLFNIQVMADFWAMLAMAACLPDVGEPAAEKYWICKKVRGWQDFLQFPRI